MELVPHTMDRAWRKTVEGSPWRSRHLYLAVIFNALNVISLATLYKLFQGNAVVRPYLSIFLLVMACLLAYAGWYVHYAYRIAKEAIDAGAAQDTPAVLSLSYATFRMYLIALILSFVVVEAVNAIAPKLL